MVPFSARPRAPGLLWLAPLALLSLSLSITCADSPDPSGTPTGRDSQGAAAAADAATAATDATDATDATTPDASGVEVPAAILRNDGQLSNDEVLYYFATSTYRVGFARDRILVQVFDDKASQLIALTFDGSSETGPEGVDERSHPTHFLLGNDRDRWVRNVPSFREVVYPNLYDGIDLAYRATAAGLKYEFRVQPGADPSAITMAYEGVDDVRPLADGGLALVTPIGELNDGAPVSFVAAAVATPAPAGTGWTPVAVPSVAPEALATRYEMRGEARYGFVVDGWDGENPLVIDPLIQSSYLGGAFNEYVRSIDIDGSGFAYYVGWTTSGDFPVTPGSYDPSYSGSTDAFVAKIHRRRSRIQFATYVGGSRKDDAFDVAVDRSRHVVISGNTESADFPVTDGSTHSGGRFDAFVARLNDVGDDLVYARYLGGSGEDFGYAVAVDGGNRIYLAGFTRSSDFPTTAGAFDEVFNALQDGWVAKVDPFTSDLIYSTCLGGTSVDFIWDVAVGADGSAFVTGSTLSKDFPATPGSFGPAYLGAQDAFVAKLDPAGALMIYCGCLGGSAFDRGYSIALDDEDAAYVCGVTYSSDLLVTAGSFDETYNGEGDGFVAKIEADGLSAAYVTYLGGAAFEEVTAIDVRRRSGRATVTGYTSSADFPTAGGAHDETYNGAEDAFVTELDDKGTKLRESTFLGGSGKDRGYAVGLAPRGITFVGGETRSTDFPTSARAIEDTLDGVRDGFVAKFD